MNPKSDTPEAWFHNEIITGLARIAALCMAGTPAREYMADTESVWIDTLWRKPIGWDEGEDRERVCAAFDVLIGRAERFPAPSEFIQCLPKRKPQEHRPLLEVKLSPEQIERNKRNAKKLAKELAAAMKTPETAEEKRRRIQREQEMRDFQARMQTPEYQQRRLEIAKKLKEMGVPV